MMRALSGEPLVYPHMTERRKMLREDIRDTAQQRMRARGQEPGKLLPVE